MPELDRGDATLWYEVRGDGPPVLLVQGVGVAGSGWRPQVDALSGRYAVCAYDNRGVGRSTLSGALSIEAMAADGLALMDALGWDRAHVVGHSMGGLIAQQIALSAPDRVRSLCLMCTFGRGEEGASMSPSMMWSAIKARLGTRAMRRAAFLELVIPNAQLAGADRAAIAAELGALCGRDLADSPPILMKQVRAMGRHDHWARLPELAAIPTLVMSAEHDRIAPPAYGRALAEAIDGARYVEIAGAGHVAPIREADEVNALLLAHLERG